MYINNKAVETVIFVKLADFDNKPGLIINLIIRPGFQRNLITV